MCSTQSSQKSLCLKASVKCLVTALTAGRPWVIAGLPAFVCYRTSPSICSRSPPGSTLIYAEWPQFTEAILSNGCRSFILMVLFGRRSPESIRKLVHCEGTRHRRWTARSEPVWLPVIESPPQSWLCILYLSATSVAGCVMTPFWCEIAHSNSPLWHYVIFPLFDILNPTVTKWSPKNKTRGWSGLMNAFM